MSRLTLKGKIFLWFGIIILVSIIMYGFLIYSVYQFRLTGERYYNDMLELKLKMAEDTELYDEYPIEKLKEFRKEDFQKPAIPLIIPKGLFIQVFLIITGGVIAIILISAAAGFLLLRRMLNQVDFITKNVRDIDEKGLHLRLKNASHELNTPLTVIKTKIDVLKQKKSITKGQYRETIDLIDSEIMRLSKITGELLLLSDLEDNGYEKEKSTINIKDIMNRILRLYENQIESKNIILETSFKGKSEVYGNPIQVEQLLFNLIDNAVKYCDTDGNLKIVVKEDKKQKQIVLNITNTTSAINKKDMPHIFERFYRTKSRTKRKNFGLGLSISKKIIEKHDGEISASFDKNKKEVTFIIKIPVVQKKK
jgi:signal transduction histidine kinase